MQFAWCAQKLAHYSGRNGADRKSGRLGRRADQFELGDQLPPGGYPDHHSVDDHFFIWKGCSMAESNPFVGTWRLISWEVIQPDGSVQHPYGKDVVGYLIYTADGYMSAEIMDPDRRQSDPNFPLEIATAQTLSDPDRARAFSTYVSYCGTYTVEGDTVTHHVKAGLIPSWTGSDQVRPFKFDQGCLIIGPRSGKQRLIWERVTKQA